METRVDPDRTQSPAGEPPREQPTVPATVRPIVELLSYQRADVESPARFNWCCWSRQVGKSFTKSLRRLLRGIQRRRTQLFLSAGQRQSRELMTKVQQHCRAMNIAARFFGDGAPVAAHCRRLTARLPNGVRIIGLPANPATIRGFTGDVLLDEFAMHHDDRAIWAAVFPTVLRDHGEIDVASTPKGCDNIFAQLRRNTMFAHSTVTLDEAVRCGLDVDADEIRRSMNDELLYRQEFGCEFLDEVSAFLTYAQIAAMEDPSLTDTFDPAALAACAGPLYAGVDIGRHRDRSVFWVVEKNDNILVTRCLRVTQGEPFARQSETLHALLALPAVRRCCIDASGIGMPLAEAAEERFGSVRVEPVVFTPKVKDVLACQLRLRAEAGTLRIPVAPEIRNDLHSVRRQVACAGPARYEAARNADGHGDRFWAACLAVRAAGSEPGAIECVSGERLRFARRGIW